jgi:hypothetical protein
VDAGKGRGVRDGDSSEARGIESQVGKEKKKKDDGDQ